MAKIFLSRSTQTSNVFKGGSNEAIEMGHVVNLMKPMLEAHGHTVKVGNGSSWQQQVALGNAFAPAWYIAVHANAGGGQGTEVFHHPNSGNGKRLAVNVYMHLAPVSPGKDRGVKTSTGYGEINRPTAPAIIVETEFYDWAVGSADLKNRHADYARGIVEGILDVAGRKKIVTPSTPEAPKPKPTTPTAPPPTLSKGANNSPWWTRHLQQSLGITVDGDFGVDTKRHVIAFQKAHHLTPDGVVGKNTWRALGH